MNIRNIAAALVSVVVTVPAINSFATDTANAKIIGNYHVVTTENCVRTPFESPPTSGFDEDTKTLLVDGEAVSAIGEAKAQFYDDGTVQLTAGKQTETSPSRVQLGQIPIAQPSLFSCDGRYTLNGEEVNLELMCNVEHPSPSISIDLGPLNFEGSISRNRRVISLTNLDRIIQSVTVNLSGSPIQQRQRICSQTALFTK